MPPIYRKLFTNVPHEEVRREAELQMIAAEAGFAPKVLDTDYKTYIAMEDLQEMCIADMYGESINTMPSVILEDIYYILKTLYIQYDIEYIDVTPYNFIERKGKTWIIDFGHASSPGQSNWYIADVLHKKKITQWNPDFR